MSGLVAATDHSGLTSVRAHLFAAITERSVGLATHPNSLAMSLSMALPVLMYFAFSEPPVVRILSGAAILISAWGLVLADSRAGLIAGALGVFIYAARIFRHKGHWTQVVLFGSAAALAYLTIVGPEGLLSSTRFGAAAATGVHESNSARLNYLNDAMSKFWDAPFVGVGIGLGSGVSVPFLLASSGGILLLAAYMWLIAGSMRANLACPRTGMSWAILASGAAMLAEQVLNNGVAERFIYWPILLGALCSERISDVADLDATRRNISAIAVENEAQ